MDGNMFRNLPVTGFMWFGVFGMAVAALLALAALGGVIYLLVLGVMAALS